MDLQADEAPRRLCPDELVKLLLDIGVVGDSGLLQRRDENALNPDADAQVRVFQHVLADERALIHDDAGSGRVPFAGFQDTDILHLFGRWLRHLAAEELAKERRHRRAGAEAAHVHDRV